MPRGHTFHAAYPFYLHIATEGGRTTKGRETPNVSVPVRVNSIGCACACACGCACVCICAHRNTTRRCYGPLVPEDAAEETLTTSVVADKPSVRDVRGGRGLGKRGEVTVGNTSGRAESKTMRKP